MNKPNEEVLNTPSAGETPMSFKDWWNEFHKELGYKNKEDFWSHEELAEESWNARDPELTALNQELAQAKEEIAKLCPIGDLDAVTSAKVKLEHMRDELAAAMGWNEHYIEKLNSSESRVAALEGKLGEMRMALIQVQKRAEAHMTDHPEGTDEYSGTMDWLYQLTLETLSIHEKTCITMTDAGNVLCNCAFSRLTALEPIKKEEDL